MHSEIGSDTILSKRGYKTFVGALRQAEKDGHNFLWIDTCCIDKTSSAELSEAINSMYEWYCRAETCNAYPQDVQHPSNSADFERQLKCSEWFTRGWTLQDLLAPSMVVFFDQSWAEIGTKRTLGSILSTITGIEECVLDGDVNLRNRSIAQRMSWAAPRFNTRPEDLAYCFLGTFDINMPLSGAGESARCSQ